MTAIEIKAYEVLKRNFPKEEDDAILIEYFDNAAEEKIDQKKDIFLTKEDKIELIKEIKETKADMIKWMFLFWIGQIGVGIAMYFLKK